MVSLSLSYSTYDSQLIQHSIGQGKEIKYIKIEKDEIKMSLFADNVIV